MSNILIVYDQPYLRDLFSEELLDAGYGVESVPRAESAILRLRRSNPDLILLDLYLDGLGGWDALHQIKRWAPHMPVLIVTAYQNDADDPGLSKADRYVLKRFTNLTGFKEKVAELIDRKAVSHLQSREPVRAGLNTPERVAIHQTQ